MGQKSVRLFIALELPAAVQEALHAPLETIREEIRSRGVRWTPPPNIHLTLKFLGDVPLSHVEDIQTALKTAVAVYPPVDLLIAEAGCFPNPKRPRIVWLGLQDQTGHLGKLQSSIEQALEPLSYPREKRPFTPHLTIGRVKRHVQGQDLSNIGKAVQQLTIGEISRWQTASVSLMESDLRPEGAHYTRRYAAPLPTVLTTE